MDERFFTSNYKQPQRTCVEGRKITRKDIRSIRVNRDCQISRNNKDVHRNLPQKWHKWIWSTETTMRRESLHGRWGPVKSFPEIKKDAKKLSTFVYGKIARLFVVQFSVKKPWIVTSGALSFCLDSSNCWQNHSWCYSIYKFRYCGIVISGIIKKKVLW